MTQRKIVLSLALLILCIPIIAFAQVKAQGVPFQDLQNQINNLQQQINNIKLTPGPTGPAGPVGPVGPMGPQGAQGLTGAVGATGATGAPGPTGSAGPAGVAGPAGEPGLDGADGWNPVVAFGKVGADGARIIGVGDWSSSRSLHASGNVYTYEISLPFLAGGCGICKAPTCVTTLSEASEARLTSVEGPQMDVTTPKWSYKIHTGTGSYENGYTPWDTSFSFVCLQE